MMESVVKQETSLFAQHQPTKRLKLPKPVDFMQAFEVLETEATPTAKVSKYGAGRLRFGGFDPPVVKPQSKYGRYMIQQYDEQEYVDPANRNRGHGSSADSALRLKPSDLNKYKVNAQRRMLKLRAEKRHDKINRQKKAQQG